MQFDPLSDAFTQIFNAEQAGHYEVTVNPASKMLGSMLSIMQSSGYVGEYQRIDDGPRRGLPRRAHRRHQPLWRHQAEAFRQARRVR